MTGLLQSVINGGTAAKASGLGQHIAGKTGTTNNYNDALFIGYSHNVITGVWTGFDDNRTLGYGETGAKCALPIWMDFMGAALKVYGDFPFKRPEGIANLLVEKATGKLARKPGPGVINENFTEEMKEKLMPGDTNKAAKNVTDGDFFNAQ